MATQAGLDTSVWPCKSWAVTGKAMTIDVGDWLRGLGLGQYEAAFRENEINEKVLPHLTAEDLKDLGVSIVGHRRMLPDARMTWAWGLQWDSAMAGHPLGNRNALAEICKRLLQSRSICSCS
jgi:hypothetical protein